jgi:peptidoglycan/LPS O-acetylase OafA/YrhL
MAERREVKGLDTLRFVAAATVALSHGAAFPLDHLIGHGSTFSHALSALYGVSFDGVAAVIIFFVISGFCIHFGPSTGAPFQAGPFWVRRGVRILLPLLGAMALGQVLGPGAQSGLAVVLWSVYCELIYYALYPALRLALRKFKLSITHVLILSLIASGAVIVIGWNAPFYWSFSIALTWLVALPAWLLGCVLAEQVAAIGTAGGPGHVEAWRLAIWLYAAIAMVVFFHAPFRIGYPALLFPFQLLAYLWIFAEITHFERVRPSRLLEWCGHWSYSLYLIHNVAIAVTPISDANYVSDWLVRIALVIVGSLVFYALVEAPSHWLARSLSRSLSAALARRGPAAGQIGLGGALRPALALDATGASSARSLVAGSEPLRNDARMESS